MIPYPARCRHIHPLLPAPVRGDTCQTDTLMTSKGRQGTMLVLLQPAIISARIAPLLVLVALPIIQAAGQWLSPTGHRTAVAAIIETGRARLIGGASWFITAAVAPVVRVIASGPMR